MTFLWKFFGLDGNYSLQILDRCFFVTYCSDILYTNFQQISKSQFDLALNPWTRVALLRNFDSIFARLLITLVAQKYPCRTEGFFFFKSYGSCGAT